MDTNAEDLARELERLREKVERLTFDRDFWAFAYKVADYHLKQQEKANKYTKLKSDTL